MSQGQSQGAVFLDPKWVLGIVITLLTTQAGIFWRVVALHERLAKIETQIEIVRQNEQGYGSSKERLAVIENQIRDIREEIIRNREELRERINP